MKLAVLGGGFTGLTASYYLSKKGHSVVLFEKELVLGGLAVGFKSKNWDWHLERAIHHLLSSETEIINFAKEIGFTGIFYSSPETASLYPASLSRATAEANNYRIIPVDTPQDFLKLPFLSLQDKLRAGIVLAFLKLSPPLSVYERETCEEFLTRTMGKRAWKILWEELFRKKFGKYAENILASFIWARIKKRSKKLGYIEGGFQRFINHLEHAIVELGVEVRKGIAVSEMRKRADGFIINQERFDGVVSTLPTPILTQLAAEILPADYLSRFRKLKFLHAVSMVLETKQPFLETTYWLNICTPDNKIMGIMQHTNFIDKKHYGGTNLLYVYNYVEFSSALWQMKDEEVFEFYKKELLKLNPTFPFPNAKYYVFRGPFAQPIFDNAFLKNKPDFETPVQNFYIANLDMTYPYDRGTNYAVKLGKQVSQLF